MRLAFISQAQARGRQAFVMGLIGAIGLAILFIAFPELDIGASQLFYKQGQGGVVPGFWLADSEFLKVFFRLVDDVAQGVLLLSIAIAVFYGLKKHPRFLASAIVATSLLLGPAIAVNAVFKEHWDRARPRQIVEFGGAKQFTPAWVISDQCSRNCSFVSGHAAAGFSFVVGYFVSQSRAWLWLGLAFGGLTGLTRIMVGAHFLSDVVFSFFIVYLIAAIVTLASTQMARQRDLARSSHSAPTAP